MRAVLRTEREMNSGLICTEGRCQGASRGGTFSQFGQSQVALFSLLITVCWVSCSNQTTQFQDKSPLFLEEQNVGKVKRREKHWD